MGSDSDYLIENGYGYLVEGDVPSDWDDSSNSHKRKDQKKIIVSDINKLKHMLSDYDSYYTTGGKEKEFKLFVNVELLNGVLAEIEEEREQCIDSHNAAVYAQPTIDHLESEVKRLNSKIDAMSKDVIDALFEGFSGTGIKVDLFNIVEDKIKEALLKIKDGE